MINNKKSIATLSLGGDLSEKLIAIANAGFYGIEICENDLNQGKITHKTLTKIIDNLGIKIVLFQALRNFEGIARHSLNSYLDNIRYTFEQVKSLNIDTVLLCSNTCVNALQNDEIIIDDLSILAQLASSYGLKIGYEALAWGTHVNSYKHAWNIVKQVNHSALGLVLDSFHILATHESITALDSIDVNKIFFVQLADGLHTTTDIINWSRHFRCYPGDGYFDLLSFVTKLIKIGYNGPISLEIFNDDLRKISPRVAAFDGMLAMKNLQDKLIIN